MAIPLAIVVEKNREKKWKDRNRSHRMFGWVGEVMRLQLLKRIAWHWTSGLMAPTRTIHQTAPRHQLTQNPFYRFVLVLACSFVHNGRSFLRLELSRRIPIG
jgi:hypothetical protein